MQMEDTRLVPAPRAQVWAALNNPEILKACIPGCESLTMTSPRDDRDCRCESRAGEGQVFG